jgi:hypothetical protein
MEAVVSVKLGFNLIKAQNERVKLSVVPTGKRERTLTH